MVVQVLHSKREVPDLRDKQKNLGFEGAWVLLQLPHMTGENDLTEPAIFSLFATAPSLQEARSQAVAVSRP